MKPIVIYNGKISSSLTLVNSELQICAIDRWQVILTVLTFEGMERQRVQNLCCTIHFDLTSSIKV